MMTSRSTFEDPSTSFFAFLKIIKFIISLILVWGEGMRKALKNWYGNMSDKQMAELLLFHHRKYSWSHKDILKLIHFKAPNPGMYFFYFQPMMRG